MPPATDTYPCKYQFFKEKKSKTLPHTHVIKTLNVVNCEVMAGASKCCGNTTMLIAGNEDGAKE